ncbi:MAG: glycoside hydrolase family 88 protein [Bacteroidaceae bacterium]|nr:glycoside hydrolase family 88 protein [Bacteroidaceae bacterium]
MELNDDIWLKKWKENLEDFEEEVPINGWEKLQADLQANDPLPQHESSPRAKIIPFRRWQVAAAAAVVVLIAGAGIWFLTSDKAPQVPTIEAPIAQIVQVDQPEETAVPSVPESKAVETTPAAPVITESPKATPAAKPASKPVVKQAEPVETKRNLTQQSVTIEETSTKPLVAQASAPAAVNATEAQPEGRPIQVRPSQQSTRQRSVNPVYSDGNTSAEVNTINRRQIRISQDERLQNVPLLRQGEAVTRSIAAEEITDMDRVFNSFTAHYNELYNQQEHLFDNGTGNYSTMDNALFLAGLVKKMQGQRSADDVKLYREMASRLVELQQPNGLWKDSLLDPTSHSANTDTDSYICYALAWGVNNGILNRAQYLEPVRHAWQSIGDCNSTPCRMAKEQLQKLQ